jgi:hypothetical protein
VARCWAGFASLGAGLIHLAVVREHLDHWVVHGVFFALLGTVQLGWGVAALARDRVPVPRLVVAGTLGVVALWALTRTAGLPIGPGAGIPEPVGRADLLAMLLHAVVIGAVLVAVRMSATQPYLSGRSAPAGRTLGALGAGALLMAAVTTPALAATEAGENAKPHFHHSGGHAR